MQFEYPSQRLQDYLSQRWVQWRGRRVEPGDIELWVGPSCAERETEAATEIVGEVHRVTASDRRIVEVSIER